MSQKLTPKQARFIREFLVDLNGTQAAIRAGYSEKTARQIAAENLTKPVIEEAIARANQERSERTGITADRALLELARIGYADIRDYVEWGEDGVKLKDSKDLTDDQARAISEVSETKGEKSSTVKFKLHDKRAAVVDICRHLGLFTDNLNLGGNITVRHEDALKDLE